MIQKVQTDVTTTPENTLETIEAIGTSSRKIIIGRQTRERIYGESGATLNFTSISIQAHSGDIFENMDGTATVTDVVGDLAYTLWGNGVRIPLQGNYQLTITTAKGSSVGRIMTTRVKVDGVTVYTYTSSSNTDHTDTINMTIGKFSVVSMEQDGEATADLVYVGGRTSVVQIQKL